jgi:hypothetical protein
MIAPPVNSLPQLSHFIVRSLDLVDASQGCARIVQCVGVPENIA